MKSLNGAVLLCSLLFECLLYRVKTRFVQDLDSFYEGAPMSVKSQDVYKMLPYKCAVYDVHPKLGPGLLEKPYQHCP